MDGGDEERGTRMNVLVVEKDALSVEVLTVRLELLGCRVTKAWSVDEAMALALAAPPDLILTEVRLHGDDNAGMRLTERLKADVRTAAVPVVVHSIYVFGPGDAPELAERVAGYLPKPFRAAQLQALLGRFVRAIAG